MNANGCDKGRKQAFISKESESFHSPPLSLTASWMSVLSLPYITPQIHKLDEIGQEEKKFVSYSLA